MPLIHVYYVGLLKHVAGVDAEDADLPPGATVRDLFAVLTARRGPDLSGALLLASGRLRESAMVLVDDHNVEDMALLDTVLGDTAEVAVAVGIYPIAGG